LVAPPLKIVSAGRIGRLEAIQEPLHEFAAKAELVLAHTLVTVALGIAGLVGFG